MSIRCLFEPRDLWVGVYWNFVRDDWKRQLDVYICVVPMLPVRLRFQWGILNE